MRQPKILVFDIETAPMLAYVYGRHDQNIGLEMIHTDWFVLGWAAKWLGAPVSTMMYCDQQHVKDIENDKAILKPLWKLLDEADVVITQNGKAFDSKRLNARFILNGMKPPSPYRHIDTMLIAGRVAAFTSKSLEYLTDKINKKYKKLKHKKYPGFLLWKACLRGVRSAWTEMRRYNIHDVLSTEELYTNLLPWDNSIDFNVYSDSLEMVCNCGSNKFCAKGFSYTATGKFQRYICKKCGKQTAGRTNLLSVAKRKSLTKSAGAH